MCLWKRLKNIGNHFSISSRVGPAIPTHLPSYRLPTRCRQPTGQRPALSCVAHPSTPSQIHGRRRLLPPGEQAALCRSHSRLGLHRHTPRASHAFPCRLRHSPPGPALTAASRALNWPLHRHPPHLIRTMAISTSTLTDMAPMARPRLPSRASPLAARLRACTNGHSDQTNTAPDHPEPRSLFKE
jgi:hypothetical protein